MHVFDFLNTKCIAGVDINMKNYLFGFHGHDFVGLNHILLELKKYLFASAIPYGNDEAKAHTFSSSSPSSPVCQMEILAYWNSQNSLELD